MKVILFRHAIAQLRSAHLNDFDRELTKEGIKKLELSALGLKRIQPQPDLILSSPYIRTQQTAKVIERVYGMDCPITTLSCLEPDADVNETLEKLKEISTQNTCVLLSGHQPHLGSLACLLLGTNHADIPLKKAGAVKIDILSNTLEWALPPKILRLLS